MLSKKVIHFTFIILIVIITFISIEFFFTLKNN